MKKEKKKRERKVGSALNRQHHAAMLLLICKTYRTDLADATRAVLRLVERYARHSMTALNRSVALLSLQHSLFLASSSFCARSQCNRVLFLSALGATRASQRALFVHEDFISIGFSVRLYRPCFHTFPLSITTLSYQPADPPVDSHSS